MRTKQQHPARIVRKSEEYHISRVFLENSKLHKYLAKKTPELIKLVERSYTLYEVLVALREVICREKLFDIHNPTIIMCNTELDEVLNMKALHVTEVKKQVYNHFQCQESFSPASTQSDHKNRSKNLQQMTQEVPIDINGTFVVQPNFLNVIHEIPGVNKRKTVFTYKELTTYTSTYILQNRDKLFDQRNHLVVICEDDILSKAFGVLAFHRGQILKLLNSQLIPLDSADALRRMKNQLLLINNEHEYCLRSKRRLSK